MGGGAAANKSWPQFPKNVTRERGPNDEMRPQLLQATVMRVLPSFPKSFSHRRLSLSVDISLRFLTPR